MSFMSPQRIRISAMVVCAAGLLAGCSPAPTVPSAAPATQTVPDDHDHEHADHEHDHPTTLTAGIAALATAATAVETRLAADDRDEADEAVHELGHLLEDLQGLVRKESLPADAEAAASKAIDELFECFDTLDTALHAEPGKGDPPNEVHASVAKRIEAAIGALRSAADTPAAPDDDEAAANVPAAQEEDEAAAIIRSAREAKEE